MFIFVVVIEGVTQPDAWDPPDPPDPYRRKQLQQSSPEYQAVLRNVQDQKCQTDHQGEYIADHVIPNT